MENILIAIISISVGVAATIFASRHYYRRSVDKELTPFMQMQSNVLSHIDKDVKTDLHIEYKGVKVDNLQQLQFLVANTGERAIRDIIKPLRLELPNEVEIMDASLLYIAPEGREVSLAISEPANSIEFDFPLLNKDEFFIFKLLIKGAPERKDLKFSIVADDLPPELEIRRLSYSQIEKEDRSENNEFELGLLVAGLVVLLLSFFTGILAHYIQADSFPRIESESLAWLNKIPFVAISSIVGYILTGILALLGGMMAVAAIFGDFQFPRSKKFRLPNELAVARYNFRVLDETTVISQGEAYKTNQPTNDTSAD